MYLFKPTITFNTIISIKIQYKNVEIAYTQCHCVDCIPDHQYKRQMVIRATSKLKFPHQKYRQYQNQVVSEYLSETIHVMKISYSLLLIIHGLIHFTDFARAYHFRTMEQVTKNIPKLIGLLWMASGLLFIMAAILYFLKKDAWSILAIVAVVFSQILILLFWKDAKLGTIPNAIILVIAIIGLAAIRFEDSYRNDVLSAMQNVQIENEIIKEKDLKQLPLPVQKYLRYVGVLGTPRVQNFKIIFEGEMRDKGKNWFKFNSEQYNFIQSPTRLFFMNASVRGLPTSGYHSYKDENAEMLIKLLSLFPVVHIEGYKLYATETVTFFNDLCMFAPAGLIDERIVWEKINDMSVRATFTSNGTTISAILYFNKKGQLVNFVSEDRISVAEMKTFPFSTPVKNYQNINGFNLPSQAEAVWQYPDG